MIGWSRPYLPIFLSAQRNLKLQSNRRGPILIPISLILVFMASQAFATTDRPSRFPRPPVSSWSRQAARSNPTLAAAAGSDFSISSSPSFAVIDVGSQGVSTITLTSLGGFTGSVNLTTPTILLGRTSLPVNGAYVTHSSLNLAANGSNSTTLTFSSGTGTFLVNVTGTSGTNVHAALVVFQVVGFYFFMSQSNPKPIPPGGFASATLDVRGINDFPGAVNFTVSINPSPGLTWTVNPAIVTGSGQSVLILTALFTAWGDYSVNVVAKSGSLTQSATISVTVGNPSPNSFPSISALPFGLPATVIGLALWALFLAYSVRLVWWRRRRGPMGRTPTAYSATQATFNGSFQRPNSALAVGRLVAC